MAVQRPTGITSLFKNHIERTHADLLLADKSGGAAAQENDSNDMSGDSSASEMDEDCGET